MLVSRCIAFNRLDTQEDDLKGPVVIPSVGDRTFYLSTIMNDITTELLKKMSKLVRILYSFMLLAYHSKMYAHIG